MCKPATSRPTSWDCACLFPFANNSEWHAPCCRHPHSPWEHETQSRPVRGAPGSATHEGEQGIMRGRGCSRFSSSPPSRVPHSRCLNCRPPPCQRVPWQRPARNRRYRPVQHQHPRNRKNTGSLRRRSKSRGRLDSRSPTR